MYKYSDVFESEIYILSFSGYFLHTIYIVCNFSGYANVLSEAASNAEFDSQMTTVLLVRDGVVLCWNPPKRFLAGRGNRILRGYVLLILIIFNCHRYVECSANRAQRHSNISPLIYGGGDGVATDVTAES